MAARFPVEEKEGPVSPNRTAEICAELVAIERILGGAEVVARGERIVPIELPDSPVQRVRARLGDDLDLCTRRATIRAGIGAGLNAKLRNRVTRWRGGKVIAIQVHRRHAVVDEVVLHIREAIR